MGYIMGLIVFDIEGLVLLMIGAERGFFALCKNRLQPNKPFEVAFLFLTLVVPRPLQ